MSPFQGNRPPSLLLPGLCAAAAAAARGVALETIFRPTRGVARVSAARHLAIYLQHVALCASVTACARLFARDRATTRYALARMEDARDCAAVDFGLSRLEAALGAQQEMFRAFAEVFLEALQESDHARK